MRLYILAITLASAVSSPPCDVCIDGGCHYKTEVFRSPPNHKLFDILAIDNRNNIIYCRFISNSYDIKLGAINLDLNKDNLKFIQTLGYVNAFAVDNRTGDFYISGQINSKYNPNRSSSVELVNNFDGLNIKRLFFKDKLYFLTNNGIYSYDNDRIELVYRNYFMSQFVIDKNNDIYFETDNGIYKLNKDRQIKLIKNINYRLLINNLYELYFCDDYKKLYKYDYNTGEIKKISEFSKSLRLTPAFDRNNNMLNVERYRSLYLLKPSEGRCVINNGMAVKVCSTTCKESKCRFRCS